MLLEKCIEHTLGVAHAWVRAACEAKGIALDSPRAGEEWLLTIKECETHIQVCSLIWSPTHRYH